MKAKKIIIAFVTGILLLSSYSCSQNVGGRLEMALIQSMFSGNSAWRVVQIDDINTESPTNGEGSVHISYNTIGVDPANNTLKYATKDPNDNWVLTTVDTGGVGWYSSLKVDPNGAVHISYFDIVNKDLKYATNASGAWGTATVDSDGDVGWSTSLVIDSNNSVHISYYDATNQSLKYATNTSGTWGATTVDSDGDVGWVTSLAIDQNNRLHICYPDDTNGAVKYATNASGAWVRSAIDTIGSATVLKGYYLERITAIAIDPNGSAHMSYYDIANEDLKYATNSPGTWVVSTLDQTGDVGSATSIDTCAYNNQVVVLIFYYDATNERLKYAINQSGGSGDWAVFAPEALPGGIGEEPTVTIGPDAQVIHITSLDPTNHRVMYTPPMAP